MAASLGLLWDFSGFGPSAGCGPRSTGLNSCVETSNVMRACGESARQASRAREDPPDRPQVLPGAVTPGVYDRPALSRDSGRSTAVVSVRILTLSGRNGAETPSAPL